MGIQVGVPPGYQFYYTAGGIEFEDKFNNASLFSGWRTHGTGANRIVAEGAALQIAIDAAVDGAWDQTENVAPKIFIGVPGFPCEIRAKLNSLPVLGINTQAGVFVSKYPGGFGAQTSLFMVRRRTAASNGLAVVYIDGVMTVLWSAAIVASPIWLRIKVGNFTYNYGKFILGYSLDGITFVDIWTLALATFPSLTEMGIGLFAANNFIAGMNLIDARFTDFKVRTITKPTW